MGLVLSIYVLIMETMDHDTSRVKETSRSSSWEIFS